MVFMALSGAAPILRTAAQPARPDIQIAATPRAGTSCPLGSSWCEVEQRCILAPLEICGGRRVVEEEKDGDEEGEKFSDVEARWLDAEVASRQATPPLLAHTFHHATPRSHAGARPGAFVPLTPCSKAGGCTKQSSRPLPGHTGRSPSPLVLPEPPPRRQQELPGASLPLFAPPLPPQVPPPVQPPLPQPPLPPPPSAMLVTVDVVPMPPSPPPATLPGALPCTHPKPGGGGVALLPEAGALRTPSPLPAPAPCTKPCTCTMDYNLSRRRVAIHADRWGGAGWGGAVQSVGRACR